MPNPYKQNSLHERGHGERHRQNGDTSDLSATHAQAGRRHVVENETYQNLIQKILDVFRFETPCGKQSTKVGNQKVGHEIASILVSR
jgi:hypothetical protein